MQKRHYLDIKKGLYLTVREREVAVALLKTAQTYDSIAKHMGISTRTIQAYINSMRLKLGAHKRSELINKLQQYRHFLFYCH